MSFSIITRTFEQTFKDKKLVNISSQNGYDCVFNFGFDFLLTVKYDEISGKCVLINKSDSQNLLFKGQPLGSELVIEKMCKIMVKNSDDYIIIRVNHGQTLQQIRTPEPDFQKNSVSPDAAGDSMRTQLEQIKSKIEKARVSIVKQTAYSINDIKHKLSMNSKAGIILHIGLFIASVVLAFGVCNYFTGFPLKEAGNMIQMPVNIKFLIAFSVVLYGIGLLLKQGMFLLLQNKIKKSNTANSISEKTLIVLSALFYSGVYIINVSRGTVVNNKDLLEALKSGYVAGAALDVYSNEIEYVNKDIKNEVLKDSIIEEFFTMDNVIITPHSAFYTDEALFNMVSISVNNMLEFKNTGKCFNEI